MGLTTMKGMYGTNDISPLQGWGEHVDNLSRGVAPTSDIRPLRGRLTRSLMSAHTTESENDRPNNLALQDS